MDKFKTQLELKNKETKTFYKLFIKENNTLISPYQFFEVKKPGYVTLEEPFKGESSDMIGKGAFHARVTEKALDADEFFSKFFENNKNGTHIRLQITVRHRDLIAYGSQDDVAVKGYTITEDVWDSVFN